MAHFDSHGRLVIAYSESQVRDFLAAQGPEIWVTAEDISVELFKRKDMTRAMTRTLSDLYSRRLVKATPARRSIVNGKTHLVPSLWQWGSPE
jgi:hypothetical protein